MKPVKQAVDQTIKQPINQSIDQTLEKSTPPFTRPLPPRTTKSRIIGLTFFLSLLITGFITCWIILPITLIVCLIDCLIAQSLLQSVVKLHLSFCAAFLENVAGIKIYCYGDFLYPIDQSNNQSNDQSDDQSNNQSIKQSDEQCLILMNHPTTADWLFYYHFGIRFFNLSKICHVLKGTLRKAPIIGWALSTAMHLFLERNFSRDQENIRNYLIYWKRLIDQSNNQSNNQTINQSIYQKFVTFLRSINQSINGPHSLQLLIFPEGTNLRLQSKQKSDEFYLKSINQSNDQSINQSTNQSNNQHKPWMHVLHPRVTGTAYILKILRELNYDQSIDQSKKQTKQKSIKQSNKEANNQSINLSNDQSTNQSTNQSNNQFCSVYNLTIAFPRYQITDVGQLFSGYFPPEIVFVCNRWTVEQSINQSNNQSNIQSINQSNDESKIVPVGDAAVEKWLNEIFLEKETLLQSISEIDLSNNQSKNQSINQSNNQSINQSDDKLLLSKLRSILGPQIQPINRTNNRSIKQSNNLYLSFYFVLCLFVINRSINQSISFYFVILQSIFYSVCADKISRWILKLADWQYNNRYNKR